MNAVITVGNAIPVKQRRVDGRKPNLYFPKISGKMVKSATGRHYDIMPDGSWRRVT